MAYGLVEVTGAFVGATKLYYYSPRDINFDRDGRWSQSCRRVAAHKRIAC